MSDDDLEQIRREELAKFLRDRREKLQPETAGVRIARRRRTPGLLREEVAETAGVSLTWYTWLEQARPTNPSARTLEGLVTALRLDATERAYLFRLARPDLNHHASIESDDELSPALLSLLHGLAPHPAYVINGRWDVLAWNRSAEIVFGGFEHLSREQRNLLHRLLLDPQWRALFVDIDAIVASSVAQFRATMATNLGMGEFVDSMLTASEHFRHLWEQQEVAHPQPYRKVLQHPQAGTLTFDYATLRPDGAPRDVRFTIYTAADESTTRRLRQLVG